MAAGGLDAAGRPARNDSAARCIVELARAHPGQLALVCAGPLGNVAQALRLEPHLPELLDRLVVAGGSLMVLHWFEHA